MTVHPIVTMSTSAFAAAQKDRNEWLLSAARIEWLQRKGIVQ